MSWLQAPPTKPAGQVQMARPFRGLVSQTAPSLQGLLTQASSRWHRRPEGEGHRDLPFVIHTIIGRSRRQLYRESEREGERGRGGEGERERGRERDDKTERERERERIRQGERETVVPTCFPDGTLAEEGGHSVVARGAVEADGDGAVVDVLAAVVAGPAIDAHAGVAADGVEAGAAVVAGVGLHQALVHVLHAVLA